MKPTRSIMLQATGVQCCIAEKALLHSVSLELEKGELVGLIGPNGAGKSTLLKVLAGLLPVSAGSISLMGEPLGIQSVLERATRIAYLEQRPTTSWPLQVEQIVRLGRLPHHPHDFGHTGRVAVQYALSEMQLDKMRERSFDTLSEGEKLRVHIARMLASETPVLLADEPVAAMDLWHQCQVMELLAGLAQGGKAIMVVMHELSLAARYCSRLILLDHGRIVAAGDAATVLSRNNLASTYHVEASLDQKTGELHLRHRLPLPERNHT